MSFSKFEISELSEESDNDYAIEFTTSDSMLGIAMSEDEMRMMVDGLERTLEESPEAAHNLQASDYATEAGQNE